MVFVLWGLTGREQRTDLGALGDLQRSLQPQPVCDSVGTHGQAEKHGSSFVVTKDSLAWASPWVTPSGSGWLAGEGTAWVAPHQGSSTLMGDKDC